MKTPPAVSGREISRICRKRVKDLESGLYPP